MREINKNLFIKDLAIGEEAVIKDILVTGEIRRRLYDLGFIKGSKVKCILKSPFKEPTAFYIKGTTIALRDEISENILCEREYFNEK